nr:MAG: replication initiator protein [Microvirus sp.]
MTCYFPLQAYRGKHLTEKGKRSIVFNPKDAFCTSKSFQVTLPCSQCIGCRLERSRQWAVRCVHESKLHKHNQFVTLTYDNAHLPSDNSLNVRHFQLFMKRLRKHFGEGIRFFHCGEYGDKYKRPHYHACIFNLNITDKKLHTTTAQGHKLFTSDIISSIWGKGYVLIGDVTFDSAAYVARYIMKKVTGDASLHHYTDIDVSTGEIISSRKPEYTTMSRRPGIAKGWYDRYKSEVFPRDYVVINNKKIKPPKFYLNQLELTDPEAFLRLKGNRIRQAKLFADDNTPERLAVKHEVKRLRIQSLSRKLDTDL